MISHKKNALLLFLFMVFFWNRTFALNQIDGIYQIATSKDFAEFANLVNQGYYYANARLVNDIDYSRESIRIAMGGKSKSQEKAFQGYFDGDGHKITVNFFQNEDALGLFSQIGEHGVVRNLIIDGTLEGTTGIGAVAWENWGTIERCIIKTTIISTAKGECTSGGIACACFEGAKIRNCIFVGSLIGKEATLWGGIVGYSHLYPVSIENCIFAPTEVSVKLDESNVISYYDKVSINVNNCFYTKDLRNIPRTGVSKTSQNELKSGELCFKLNSNQENIVWKQTIGEDDYPYPFGSHKIVYATGVDCSGKNMGNAQYSNNYNRLPNHKIENGECKICGIKNNSIDVSKGQNYVIAFISLICVFLLILFMVVRNAYKTKYLLLYENLEKKHEIWQLRQMNVEKKSQSVLQKEEEPKDQYSTMSSNGCEINDLRIEALYCKIISAMEKEKLYLSADLSEKKLAEEMCTNVRTISMCINMMCNETNFKNWLNNYRINTAIHFLDNNPLISIDELYSKVGFSSYETFNRNFKRVAGMSAKQYLTMHVTKVDSQDYVEQG